MFHLCVLMPFSIDYLVLDVKRGIGWSHLATLSKMASSPDTNLCLLQGLVSWILHWDFFFFHCAQTQLSPSNAPARINKTPSVFDVLFTQRAFKKCCVASWQAGANMLLFTFIPFQRRRCGRCWHTAARLRWQCRASACTSHMSPSSTTAPRPSSSAPLYRAPSSASRKWSTAARSPVSLTPKVGTQSLRVGLHWQLWYFTPRYQVCETCPRDYLRCAPMLKC